MKARKLKLGINMDNEWMYRAYWKRGQGSITHRVMFLSRFSHLYVYLSLMKNFHTLFLATMKARKLKLGKNMDNGWMYHAYRKGGQGPIALGLISLDSIFFNFLCILLITFCTCGPTSRKLISYLLCRLGKVWYAKRGQQPITLGVTSLGMFSNGCFLPIMKNFSIRFLRKIAL